MKEVFLRFVSLNLIVRGLCIELSIEFHRGLNYIRNRIKFQAVFIWEP